MSEEVKEIKKPKKEHPTRFKKGNPGGPGRPKGTFSLVGMIKDKLQEKGKGKDKTYAEYFIDQLIKKAVIDGDVAMMKDIIDRIDGKPKQALDMTTNGESLNSITDEQADRILKRRAASISESISE